MSTSTKRPGCSDCADRTRPQATDAATSASRVVTARRASANRGSASHPGPARAPGRRPRARPRRPGRPRRRRPRPRRARFRDGDGPSRARSGPAGHAHGAVTQSTRYRSSRPGRELVGAQRPDGQRVDVGDRVARLVERRDADRVPARSGEPHPQAGAPVACSVTPSQTSGTLRSARPSRDAACSAASSRAGCSPNGRPSARSAHLGEDVVARRARPPRSPWNTGP